MLYTLEKPKPLIDLMMMMMMMMERQHMGNKQQTVHYKQRVITLPKKIT